MKEWSLLWKCNWCILLDGLIGVVTLNKIKTHYGLDSAKHLARYRYQKGRSK